MLIFNQLACYEGISNLMISFYFLIKQSYEVTYLWALLQFWQCAESITEIDPRPS